MLGFISASKCSIWSDKTLFLDQFNFYEKHELSGFSVPAEKIIEAVSTQDLRKDHIINTLLTLRELPSHIFKNSSDGQQTTFSLNKFTVLSQNSHEILFGLAGEFWKPNFGLFNIKDANQFLQISDTRIAKLVLRYKVIEQSANNKILRTETFIYCPSKYTKLLFTGYWLVIRPFSGWIRRRILKGVYQQVSHD